MASNNCLGLAMMGCAAQVFVYLLDESCLRMYLGFAPNLHSLLQSWGIAQQGAEAFRKGFCSRKLTNEFADVRHALLVC